MKPFFYKINAGDLLNFATDPDGENVSLLKFAKDLVRGESETSFIQEIIDEAKNYKETKAKSGRCGGLAKSSTALAKASTALANSSTALAKASTPLASNSNRKDIEKKTFSENVSLTEAEYQKLVLEHGREFTLKCIEKLSAYKLSSGKKYKSDAGAIRTWVIDEVKKTFRSSSEVLF